LHDIGPFEVLSVEITDFDGVKTTTEISTDFRAIGLQQRVTVK